MNKIEFKYYMWLSVLFWKSYFIMYFLSLTTYFHYGSIL